MGGGSVENWRFFAYWIVLQMWQELCAYSKTFHYLISQISLWVHWLCFHFVSCVFTQRREKNKYFKNQNQTRYLQNIQLFARLFVCYDQLFTIIIVDDDDAAVAIVAKLPHSFVHAIGETARAVQPKLTRRNSVSCERTIEISRCKIVRIHWNSSDNRLKHQRIACMCSFNL